jgi:hypothetical protein
MSASETLGISLPKLPDEAVKAIRGSLLGKVLGRTAALLSLVLLVVGSAGAVKLSLGKSLNIELSPPWLNYVLLLGLPFLVVAVQLVVEWHAAQIRRERQDLAVRTDTQQAGYFRIGPYLDTPEDRAKFSRPDKTHKKVLDWIEQSAASPLYLAGDSGSGKSSLLNAFVLPTLRERGWTVVEARAWQDPIAALREALTRLADAKRERQDGTQDVLTLIEAAAKRAGARLLLVLDQFEEFVILGKLEQQHDFADLLARLSASVNGVKLLLVLRSDYQTFLEEIGLPPPVYGKNFYQVARFTLVAAAEFLKHSRLNLRPDARDRLLASAAELDECPGLVRPITLNVIGHVLASSLTAPSLDAEQLVRRYIEQTVEQPAIRDFMRPILEQLITEQGTKRPRSEKELAEATSLRHGEVRSALNGLGLAALARPLDPTQGMWELSHDFIARAVARYLGRHRRDLLGRAGAYTAPALLAVTLLAMVGGLAWNRLSQYERIAQRAYLSVDSVRVLRHSNSDGQVSFEVKLHNSGNTPASIEAGALHLFVLGSESDLPRPRAPFLLKDKLQDIDQHGHSLDVPARGDAVLTTFLCFCLDEVRGNVDAVLLGYLPYIDAFGDHHAVRWGWVVDLTDAYLVPDLPTDIGAFKTGDPVDDETVQEILRSVVPSIR